MVNAISTGPQIGTATATSERADRLEKMQETARSLEASFLSEMLKQAGFGKPQEAFGGGVGEEQFASFLCDEYAKSFAQAGGIGLAESIFQAMQKGMDNAG